MASSSNPPLYDYLYRDSNRIASYASQALNGFVTGLQRTHGKKNTSDADATLGMTPLIMKGKAAGERSVSQTASVDPHDTVTSDVLSHLMSTGRVSSDIVKAHHGSLVTASGTLVFIDSSIARLTLGVLDQVISANLGGEVAELMPGVGEPLMLHLAKGMLTGMDFPSAFLLHCPGGHRVAGTLKDAGMEEPISTYYFKHGASGLSDVHLIGIKEVPNKAVTIPDTQMLGAGQNVAQSLHDMIFPPNCIKVTPIALFRKI